MTSGFSRRDFVLAGGGAVLAASLASRVEAESHIPSGGQSNPTYHILGVPLRSGSLYPGNENDAQAYGDAHFLSRLETAGCKAIDEGNVAIPNYLPHHSIPPIRSWPGPRIAWECVAERIAPYLKRPGHIPLLIGCDCSVVVGTTQALMQSGAPEVHVLYIDGDFDDASPDPARCQSAASCGVWLLTHNSPFWAGPVLQPAQVTVIGCSNPARTEPATRARSMPLAEVRRVGTRQAAQQVMQTIPASARIVVHLDIDVFRKSEMPAAYFPHEEGLTLGEGAGILKVLLQDPRVGIIEISEYAALRDIDQVWVGKLADLLADAMRRA